MASPPASWSLTGHLLASQQPLFKSATQHPFLLAGAEGRLSKTALSRWLATDRLYIHSYIRAAGQLLASLDLPARVPPSGEEAFETQLADWLIEALVAVRREERLFIDVAARYGLPLDIAVPLPPAAAAAAAASPADAVSSSKDGGDFTGLTMIRYIFASITANAVGSTATATNPPTVLPWLEGAVTFWGTERCYLEAWSFARDRARERGAEAQDADGGALRREFIPNWSSEAFRDFVERLGALIDAAVSGVLAGKGGDEAEKAKAEILGRIEGRWKTLLEAERAFWPDV
ncbi:hypothetical protein VTK26DRAFT_4609 [Humicola hyalothermophila]